MTNLTVICISYNYASFIRAHLAEWNLIRDKADNFLIVDDQSSLKDEDYEAVAAEFADNFIITDYPKMAFNGMNQLRAIRFGMEHLGVQEDSLYWVVDADDVPTPDAIDAVRTAAETHTDAELFAFSRIDDDGQSCMPCTPKLSHPFWLRDAPTSSLVVRGSALRRVWRALFRDTWFKDVWYDIRISACIPNSRTHVSQTVTHFKLSHGENDSERYKKSQFLSYSRIGKSILYFFIGCINSVLGVRK